MARKRVQTKREPRIVENEMDESDDEEIDEDEAFNSDDELKYGSFFVGKKKSKSNVKKIGHDDSDDEDNDSKSEEGSSSNDDRSKDWAGESDSEGEDDDGGQYMLDLLNNLDKQVPGKDNSTKVSGEKKGEGYNGKIRLDNVPAAAVYMPESEFGAAVVSVPSAANNFGSGNKLTLDSLMSGISDTQGFTHVQRTMRALSSGHGATADLSSRTKKLETTPAPVPRVVSERASRKVHYEATTEDVSQWKDIIHTQRDAETLDFRVNKGGAKASCVTKDGLIDKFEVRTEFEEELARALEVAGMESEEAIQSRERKRLLENEGLAEGFGDDDANGGIDDDLGTGRISLEEYKKRHAELAKMRALMFYEEQKRHRINKIKSKKFRKIQKKRREREKDAEDEGVVLDDPHLNREKLEKDEMDRMKERMTLAHKNTSKWARRVLRRGANMDADERRALSLQIAKGNELRRKVMGDDSGEEASNDETETEEDLLKQARDILAEKSDLTEGSLGKRKGLFELDFMKRGIEAQRARAKEEARGLLEELEANEADGMPTDSEDESDSEMPKRQKATKPKVASEEETSKVLPTGKLVASSLEFGKSDAFAVTLTGNVDANDAEAVVEDEQSAVNHQNKSTKKKRKSKKNKNDIQRTNGVDSNPLDSSGVQMEQEKNPWLIATKNESSTSANNSSKFQSNVTKNAKLTLKVDINAAASMLVDAPEKEPSKKAQESVALVGAESEKTPKSSDAGLASLSQAELVRRAFASPDDLEAAEEFQQEKTRMRERDDPTRQQKEEKIVSGWGSWAGVGAPPPRKPRQLPKHLSAPLKKAERPIKRKDDGMSTVIINEKRLKKTAQFQMAEIPYPYRSRQEYEKAIAGNIGHEWNTMNGVKEMTRPSVIVRAGKVIKPISKKAKSKKARAPAKF